MFVIWVLQSIKINVIIQVHYFVRNSNLQYLFSAKIYQLAFAATKMD